MKVSDIFDEMDDLRKPPEPNPVAESIRAAMEGLPPQQQAMMARLLLWMLFMFMLARAGDFGPWLLSKVKPVGDWAYRINQTWPMQLWSLVVMYLGLWKLIELAIWIWTTKSP